MAALKFTRKLGTTWVFPLTWLDRDGNRQQITGWQDPKAFWRRVSADPVIRTDTTGFTVEETLDPATLGDYTYRVAHNDQAEFSVGTYWLDFEATMAGDVVPAPEEYYVVVEVLA